MAGAAGDSAHYMIAVVDGNGNIIGKPYPFVRVTTVIKAIFDKSGAIGGWSERSAIDGCKLLMEKGFDLTLYDTDQIKGLLKEYNQTTYQKRAIAAVRGNSAHNVLETAAKQGIRAATKALEDVRPDHLGYAKALLAWWKEERPKKVIFSEQPIVSFRYRFAGTGDLLYIRQSGEVQMLDAKTAKRVYEDMPIQLGAYDVGLREHGLKPDSHAILQVADHPDIEDGTVVEDKDGTKSSYKLHVVEPKGDLFLGALVVYRKARVKEGKLLLEEDLQEMLKEAVSG